MFDSLFRKSGSDRSGNIHLSVSSSTISLSSILANFISTDANSYRSAIHWDSEIRSISEEGMVNHHANGNDEGNDNNHPKHNDSFLFPPRKNNRVILQQQHSSQQQQQQRPRGSSCTNLLPQNQGIAQQRNLIDELEHYHQTDVLEGVTQQLQSMLVHEQERAMYDVHAGTPHVIKDLEGCQTEEQWMNQMDDAIALCSTQHHPALQLAMHTNLQYVKDQRWKFLRAEDWNVGRAVDRLARFCELKLEHFGSERLCRELTIDDLSLQDLEWWKETGFLQVLDENDTSGRPVAFFFGKAQMSVPVETVIRVSIYLTCLSAQDPQVQRTGIVQGYWGHGQPFLASPHRATLLLKAWRSMPLRSSAKHFCYDNEQLKPLFRLMAQEWNLSQATRFRAHFGSAMECIYNLMTFGISRESMPVREDGSVTLEYHRSFLEALKVREKAERLLRVLHHGNGNLNDPFLAHREHDDLMQHMWLDDDDDNNMVEDDPLPLDASMNDIIPDDILTRLIRSNTSTDEPLPIETSLSDLESMPKSFLARLARSSFLRSGGGPSSPAQSKNDGMSRETTPSTENHPPERAIGMSQLMLVPGRLDVILGRGRHNRNKPGNRKLQAKLEEYYEQYENSDKYQKTTLAESILNTMKEEGSRFLVRQGGKNHGVWVQVTHEKARDKIAHDFRNMRGTIGTKRDDDTVKANREKRSRSVTSSTDSTTEGFFKRPFGL